MQLLQEYGNDVPVILLGEREIGRHFVRKDRLLLALKQAVGKTVRNKVVTNTSNEPKLA
jgi:hypothetical protein